MRRRFNAARISAVVLLPFVTACYGATVTELTGPDAVRCATSVGSTVGTIPAAGGQVTVPVVAARECTWSASANAGWIQVSPASGQGEALLALSIAENTQNSSRSARISVNDQRLTVTQEARASAPTPPGPTPPGPTPPGPTPPGPTPPGPGSSCVSALDPAARAFSRGGGEGVIQVAAHASCVWTVSASAGWINIQSNTVGVGNGQVRYQVSEREGRSGRTGTIRVGEHTHTVTQSGRGGRGGNDDDDDDDDNDEDDD